jgi:hypothetical protein
LAMKGRNERTKNEIPKAAVVRWQARSRKEILSISKGAPIDTTNCWCVYAI